MDRAEINRKQREYRRRINDRCTKRYEKTIQGFVMRMYRNMKSRVTGVQKQKFHLYAGKELLAKPLFYQLALSSSTFVELYEAYKASGWDRRLAPTPNRIDPSVGYTVDNIEFITHSANSRLGSLKKAA